MFGLARNLSRGAGGSVPWVWLLGADNLITTARAFDSWDILDASCTIGANEESGPDGSLTADTFTESVTTLETHQIGDDFVNGSGTYEVVVVAKALPSGRDWMRIYVMDNGGGSGVAKGTWVNLSTGAFGTQLGTVTNRAVTYWRGWPAVSFRYSGDGTAGDNTLRIASGGADDNDTYAGDGLDCFRLAMAGVRLL
jgi:hypothetical protein